MDSSQAAWLVIASCVTLVDTCVFLRLIYKLMRMQAKQYAFAAVAIFIILNAWLYFAVVVM